MSELAPQPIATTVRVPGRPRPQGSLKLFRAPDGHEVAKYNDVVYEWRRKVTTFIRGQVGEAEPYGGPMRVSVLFEMPRPKDHYGTGRNAGMVKASAAPYPANTRDDIDKLVRAILDSITDSQVIWHDDGQVVHLAARKVWADAEPGCTISVVRLT
jgi:crossover junction endodeoxyribonuclease RusA